MASPNTLKLRAWRDAVEKKLHEGRVIKAMPPSQRHAHKWSEK